MTGGGVGRTGRISPATSSSTSSSGCCLMSCLGPHMWRLGSGVVLWGEHHEADRGGGVTRGLMSSSLPGVDP